MIKKEDILSLEYLKKTEFTGSHDGLRYRLEKKETEEGTCLRATVWPEPYNFASTKEELKQSMDFDFSEDGVVDAVAWMNDRYYAVK